MKKTLRLVIVFVLRNLTTHVLIVHSKIIQCIDIHLLKFPIVFYIEFGEYKSMTIFFNKLWSNVRCKGLIMMQMKIKNTKNLEEEVSELNGEVDSMMEK